MSSPPTQDFKVLNIDAESGVEGGKDHIRYMGRVARSKLTEGKLIQVVNSKGEKIMDFPLALFTAASTKKEVVVDDKIVLASNLSTEQATRLFELLLQISKAGCVRDFPAIERTREDLEFHSVAEALGLESFTQRIFDLYFKRVNTSVASVPNIEAIGAVRTPPGDKIYKQMAWTIANRYYDNILPGRAAFEKYLATNNRLRAAVDEVVACNKAADARAAQQAQNHAAFLERERFRQEKALAEAERTKAWETALRAQQKAEKAKFAERKEKEMTVRKSMLEKKRAGQKLNAEKARAHERLFGKAMAP